MYATIHIRVRTHMHRVQALLDTVCVCCTCRRQNLQTVRLYASHTSCLTEQETLHLMGTLQQQKEKKRNATGNKWREQIHHHHHHHHQSLNREGCWCTTDDFATSFLHFSLFSTALWDLPNSRPVHSLMLSSHLFLCLPCLRPPFTVTCKMVWAKPDERETCPYQL